MSWSKIKHAINSTLGTKNFKPLNEIVSEAFETIVGVQNSLKSKLETGSNNFYVSRAKNVDVDGFVGALEEYNTARSISGSYVGTGHYRESPEAPYANTTVSLTFPFVPKFVVIQYNGLYASDNGRNYRVWQTATLIPESGNLHIAKGKPEYSEDFTFADVSVSVSADGKTISWVIPGGWTDYSEDYLNRSAETYYYTAIG